MDAVYLPDGTAREPAIKALAETVPSLRLEESLRLTFAAKRPTLPAQLSEEMSALVPLPPGSCHTVAVAPGVRFLQGHWGLAFLVNVSRAVRPGGKLLVPFHDDRTARAAGFWSLKDLQRLYGHTGKVLPGSKLVEFHPAEPLAFPPSVLSWFCQEHATALLQAVAAGRTGKLPAWTAPWYQEFLQAGQDGCFTAGDGATEAAEAAPTDRLQEQFGALSYLTHGISYKNAVLNRIIADHLSGRKDLRALDQGGGPGFLSMELLLEHPEFSRAVLCDINPGYLNLTRQVYAQYRGLLHGRFSARIGAAQDLVLDGDYDLITFIGSLLYVPRTATGPTLDRAWAALRSGGLLVVHENIKNPSYVRDHDVMFTIEEIESYLSRYGRIHYYQSAQAAPLEAGEVGLKTVFRVVRKK